MTAENGARCEPSRQPAGGDRRRPQRGRPDRRHPRGAARRLPGAAIWVADDASERRHRRGRAGGRGPGRQPRPPARQGRQRDRRRRGGARAPSRRRGCVLLCDGDLGDSAARLAPLVEAVEAGECDLAVAAFAAGSAAASASRSASPAGRSGASAASRRRRRSPASGRCGPRRCAPCLPFAHGFGMEIGMTVDAVRAGYRLREYELDLEHRATGRTPRRLPPPRRQLRDFARVYASRGADRLARRAMILAIDQGTTGTTCLVFDGEGRIAGRAYSEFEQHFPRPGWVEHDADEIWEVTRRVAAEAIADAGIEGARARRRSGSPTSARPSSPGTRRRGEPRPPRAGLAGPPHRRRAATSCARPATRRWSASAPGSSIDPYFSGTKIEWLLRNAEGAERAVFGTIDSWLALQAHRPPRHRLLERLADDAVRHPPARLGRGALRAARRRPGAPARAAALGRRLRHDLRVRRRGAGGRDRRRPAGGALRPGLPRARDGEEHLRHRQLRPPQHRRRGARSRPRACSTTVAWGLGERGRLRARGRRSSSPAPPCSGCATGSGSSTRRPRPRRWPPRSTPTTASTSSPP